MHRHVARRRAAAPPTGGIIVTMPPPASVTVRMLRCQRATRCLLDAGLLLAAILLAGVASVLLLRQDVNWDLQNYHFYNAWAFAHGRLGWDLAPAQVQTFHNPLLDLPFYCGRGRLAAAVDLIRHGPAGG